jgi:hypothetical protein
VLTRTAALLLAAALTVAGCSSSDDDPGGTVASTPTASETPYLPVPSGVELTPPGSQLSVGDHAVVAYEPRQGQVGALDIRVTRLEKTSIDDFSAWQLSADQKKSNPYYVHAAIENVGDTDLGGRPVPLYVVNDQNVLLESTPFASSFAPCPSTPFPDKFGPGAKAQVCLVYLAPNHGDLVSVSFRPEETFNPITWTGDIEKYEPPKPKKSEDSKKHKGQ